MSMIEEIKSAATRGAVVILEMIAGAESATMRSRNFGSFEMESESRLEKLARLVPIMEHAMATSDLSEFGLLAYQILEILEEGKLYEEGINAAGHLHYQAVRHYVTTHNMSQNEADSVAEAIFGFRGIAARLYKESRETE